MTIEIFHCKNCDNHHLTLHGMTLFTAFDKGICDRFARILTECRNVGYREAINKLINDIGYSEENAKELYMSLMEQRRQGTTVN